MIPPQLQEAIDKEDFRFITEWLFPDHKAAQNLTFYQCYIGKQIAFAKSRRISISAYTRYGKTQIVAIAVCIYILINKNKKIKFIGPTDDQAGLIKDYMAELILGSRNNIMLDLTEIRAVGAARIKAEASQKRMTFRNGCEYRVVTAHGKGFTAMGHGGDLVIMDEAAMISRESYAKIVRMLGDDPENSMLVELYNPWDRDTKAFDHSISSRFLRIQIDWRIGIQEGRVTNEFITEMKEDMTPLEFCVLYESRFPDEAEDSLHSLAKIEAAEKLFFNFEDELKHIVDKLKYPDRLRKTELEAFKHDLVRYKMIISCDPADMGLDFTVVYWGIERDGTLFEPYGVWHEPKSDPMNIVGRLIKKTKSYVDPMVQGEIKLDKIGIGVGPESRLREIKNEQNLNNIRIIGCHYGEQALNKTEFLNKKAENNFRLKALFAEGQLALGYLAQSPDYPKLKTQLISIKWKITSSEKKRIIDPEEKSPDFNDALVYFIWHDKKSLTYSFL